MTDSASLHASATPRYTERQEALISAASTLFNLQGVVGTTLSDVGLSLGLLKNSVTYYFRKKEDLVFACFVRAIRVSEALIDRAAAGSGVADRIQELIRAYVALQHEIELGRSPSVVAFHEIRALPSPHAERLFSEYTAMFRRLRGLLEGPETEHWSRADLNSRAHLLISVLHGIRTLVPEYEPEDHDRLVERLSSITLHGIQGTAATWVREGAELAWLREVPGQSLEAQFLRVATELINEQGYAGASVSRIAERLNLTKGGFYYYNDTKEDLVAQCFARSFATIRKAINLTETYGGSSWDHICSIARGLVRFQLSADGPLLRSTANTALPDPALKAHVAAELGRVKKRIAGIVVGGLIDHSIRPVDPELAAHVILRGIMAAAELKRWVGSADEPNAADLYVQPLVRGLLS